MLKVADLNEPSLTSAPRPPQQERSRDSWERVLTVGLELFADRGWAGLTIAEVCRRADVTAPSIYARVDGKAGLFRAVHARWLEQVDRSEAEATSGIVGVGDADPTVASAAAAEVMVRLFRSHEAILRAVSDRAPHDPALHARGSEASRAMIERLAATVRLPPRHTTAILRTVYAECVLRLRYGPAFLTASVEPDDAFLTRMRRMASRLAGLSAEDGPTRG